MAYVNKTFVIPDFATKQTKIDPETGMAEGFGTARAGFPFAMLSSAKPIKNTQIQVTTPYARADMIANRNKIGLATKDLNDALKAREGVGYSIVNALSNIPQQQGAGSWLTDFARAFGSSASNPINAATNRAQQVYEAKMKDLATILAYDKAMGDTVRTDLGYMYPENNTDSNMLALAMMLANK